MTQIADITALKDNAGASFTLSVQQPQGASPAVWYKRTAESRDRWLYVTHQARRTENSSSKQRVTLNVPYNGVDGKLLGKIPMSLEVTVPDSAPQTAIGDAYALLSGFLSSAVVKDSFLTQSAMI